jgi:hypothetical protein
MSNLDKAVAHVIVAAVLWLLALVAVHFVHAAAAGTVQEFFWAVTMGGLLSVSAVTIITIGVD